MITNSSLQLLPATSDNATLFISLQSASSGRASSILSATALTYNPFSRALTINGLTWPTTSGTSGQVLTTDGLGTLSWAATSSGALVARPVVASFVTTSAITPTSALDMITISFLDVPLTINSMTGTVVDGQRLLIRIRDNGTAQGISWDTSYRSVGADKPGTTVAGKWQYIGCVYNSVGIGTSAVPNPRWDVIALNTEL